MIDLQMWNCDACLQSRNLKVKFVGHVGEVAKQTISGREKVVGVDVIAVHRMLKNNVPASEYLFMTESLVEQCGPDVRETNPSLLRVDEQAERSFPRTGRLR